MDWQSSEVFNMKLNCYMLNQSFEMLKSIFIHLFHCFCNHYWDRFFSINANYLNWIMEKSERMWTTVEKIRNPQIFIYFDIVMQMFVQIWKIWWNFSDDATMHVCLWLCQNTSEHHPNGQKSIDEIQKKIKK